MRLTIYIAGFTALALVLGYLLFAQNGIDPLAPEVRTIMLLSILVAAYIGVRLAMVVRAFERRAAERGQGPEQGAGGKSSAFSRWGRSKTLDARLEARRERLRQAQEAEERREG